MLTSPLASFFPDVSGVKVPINFLKTSIGPHRQDKSVGLGTLLSKFLSYSLRTSERVGQEFGLNSATLAGSNGTQIFPVFGWTHQGLLSKWFIPFETFASNLG